MTCLSSRYLTRLLSLCLTTRHNVSALLQLLLSKTGPLRIATSTSPSFPYVVGSLPCGPQAFFARCKHSLHVPTIINWRQSQIRGMLTPWKATIVEQESRQRSRFENSMPYCPTRYFIGLTCWLSSLTSQQTIVATLSSTYDDLPMARKVSLLSLHVVRVGWTSGIMAQKDGVEGWTLWAQMESYGVDGGLVTLSGYAKNRAEPSLGMAHVWHSNRE